jgi:uncharacterized protein YjbI with pentapeptide repeats
MADTILIKRGLESNRLAYTPLLGELIWTTDVHDLWIGDGTTAGGLKIVSNIETDLHANYYTKAESDARFLRGDTNDTFEGNLLTIGNNLEVVGDTVLQGDLIVNGNMTTIDTDNLKVKDALIELQSELNNADLYEIELNNAILWGTKLNNTDLSEAELKNADLREAELSNANLKRAELNNTNMYKTIFNNANLERAKLNNVYSFQTEFMFSNLKNANFCYSVLIYPKLYGVQNYRKAKFCKTTLVLFPDWRKLPEDFIKRLKLSRFGEAMLREMLKEFNLQDAKKFFEQFSDIKVWFDSIKLEALKNKDIAKFTIKTLIRISVAGYIRKRNPEISETADRLLKKLVKSLNEQNLKLINQILQEFKKEEFTEGIEKIKTILNPEEK